MLDEHAMYYLRWRGEISGPVSGQQVRQMLERGRITRFHDLSTDKLAWRQLQRLMGQGPYSTMSNPTAPAKSESVSARQDTKRNDAKTRSPELDGAVSAEIINVAPKLPPLRSDYSFMPVAELFQVGIFRRPMVRWLTIFCTLPLLILMAHEYLAWGFAQSAWLLEGFFCFFWAVFFFQIMQPERTLWKTGLAFALFTAFIGIPVLVLWRQVPLIKTFYSGIEGQGLLSRLLGFVLGVGLFEELCKAIPFFIINPRRYGLRTPGDGLLLGIMSGLGFALIEGVGYSINYSQNSALLSTATVTDMLMKFQGGQELFTQQMAALNAKLAELYGGVILVQFVRLMILPLLHAAWSGVVGYYVGFAWLRGQWGGLFLGLFLSAGLHGLYDFFQGTIYHIVFAGMSVALLLSIMIHHHRTAATIARDGVY